MNPNASFRKLKALHLWTIPHSIKPQKEEGIEKCIWVSQESLVHYIPYLRSYAREVLAYYIQYVQNPLGIKFVA